MARIPDDIRATLDEAIAGMPAAFEGFEDGMFIPQLELSRNMFANNLAAAAEQLNPRSMKELDFTFNDIRTFASELTEDDHARLAPSLDAIEGALAALRGSAALPAELVAAIKALRAKLKERKGVLERALYRPPESAPEPIPHPPAELRDEASHIAAALQENGFDTPELDELVADTGDELGQLSIERLVEELDLALD
ncbi:MAG: hypothetical protein ACSLFQ_05975 [Thermoanaerobaculia bacterium]